MQSSVWQKRVQPKAKSFVPKKKFERILGFRQRKSTCESEIYAFQSQNHYWLEKYIFAGVTIKTIWEWFLQLSWLPLHHLIVLAHILCGALAFVEWNTDQITDRRGCHFSVPFFPRTIRLWNLRCCSQLRMRYAHFLSPAICHKILSSTRIEMILNTVCGCVWVQNGRKCGVGWVFVTDDNKNVYITGLD